jgi:hypothetical protein
MFHDYLKVYDTLNEQVCEDLLVCTSSNSCEVLLLAIVAIHKWQPLSDLNC